MISRWHDYIQEFIRLLQAYIFAVVYLGLFRIVLIVYFSDKMNSGTSLGDIFLAMAHGFRYDSAVATYFILVPFLANAILIPLNLPRVWLRTGFGSFMLLTLTISFVITIPYFQEYDSQFDYFLFEILYDDRYAIMRTIIDEYYLFGNLIMIAVVSTLGFFLLRQWQKLSLTPVLRLLHQSKNLYCCIDFRSNLCSGARLVKIKACHEKMGGCDDRYLSQQDSDESTNASAICLQRF